MKNEIILDVSANTFKNNLDYFKDMVRQVNQIDSGKYDIIFKTQLFHKSNVAAKENICLDTRIFSDMKSVCEDYAYKFTSSVFDIQSLNFLLKFDAPFIKIACRQNLYYLVGEIPRNIPVYISINKKCNYHINDMWLANCRLFSCVPKYPAGILEYMFVSDSLDINISDHTAGLELFENWQKYTLKNAIDIKHSFEIHYVLEHNIDDNPDSGVFAKTIDDLRKIL